MYVRNRRQIHYATERDTKTPRNTTALYTITFASSARLMQEMGTTRWLALCLGPGGSRVGPEILLGFGSARAGLPVAFVRSYREPANDHVLKALIPWRELSSGHDDDEKLTARMSTTFLLFASI